MTALTITRGDTERIDLVLKQPNGQAVNLTGARLRFYTKQSPLDLDINAVLAKDSDTPGDFDITNAVGGLATVLIEPADTESLLAAVLDTPLRWEVQVEDVLNNIYTLGSGTIIIASDIVLSPGTAAPAIGPNSWSYDVTTTIGKVRLLCQDFDLTEMIFSDAEIQAFLDLNEQDLRWAAAQALDVIAANEVYVQKRIKLLDLNTDGPAEATALIKIAAGLRNQAATTVASVNDLFDWAEQSYNTSSAWEIIRNGFLRGH